MKLYTLIVAVVSMASVASSARLPIQAFVGSNVAADLYLVELSPGETRWIGEDDKWVLRRVCGVSTTTRKRYSLSFIDRLI